MASGLLTGKYNDGIPKETRLGIESNEWLHEHIINKERLAKVKALGKIAADLGISQAVLAVAWCLKNPNVSTVILGASKERQLEETLTASEAAEKLTPEVLLKIEQTLQDQPVQPK